MPDIYGARGENAITSLGLNVGGVSQEGLGAMALTLVLVVLAVLFAFVDVWYFVRFFFLLLRFSLKKLLRRVSGGERMIFPQDFLSREYRCYGIVLPSDLDFMLHMNNSKYLREMDFGRVGLNLEWGLGDVVRKLGGRIVLNAAAVRYRRSLQLFQTFVITTKILCWDDSAIYFEQKVIARDGFVCTLLFAKIAVRGVTAPAIFQELVGSGRSPPPPPEVHSWIESIARSSTAMKREGNGVGQNCESKVRKVNHVE